MTITSLADPAPPRARDAEPVPGAPFAYGFDAVCSVLVGWRRRDAVLRLLSPDSAIVGGVAGLRPGDTVRLVLYRDEVTVRDCRVTRTTLQGVELAWAGPGESGRPALQ